ncbi:hypothetical protein [Variovorax sp. GT1P44]|uniref:hypothetical protein n=1 Tax=Variovorax sp. GT1P44 TaxID=3443742 RepID=UPI003F47046D
MSNGQWRQIIDSAGQMGRAAATTMLAAVLIGCATDAARLPIGTTRAEALQKLGRPTGSYSLPDSGERLQYSREPAGYEIVNVDLDAAGRVVSVRSMWTYTLYNNPIELGKWNDSDVLRAYGKPYQVSRVASFDGVVWSWQYLTNTCRGFFMSISIPQAWCRATTPARIRSWAESDLLERRVSRNEFRWKAGLGTWLRSSV